MSGGILLFPCKSETVSPEIDFEPFFASAWRIVCNGKYRCHPQRVKSLKDTESSAATREFTTHTSAVRWAMRGAAMVGRPEEGRCVAGPEASQLPVVLMGEITPAFSIFRPACVTRSLIAFFHQRVLEYRASARSKFEALTLLTAHLGLIFHGSRCPIVGRNEEINVSPRPWELLPAPRVLILGRVQLGAAAP
jgi:hypothetical protein